MPSYLMPDTLYQIGESVNFALRGFFFSVPISTMMLEHEKADERFRFMDI